jgi:hypothetical protein
MSDNGQVALKGKTTKILEEIPPGESRLVIFTSRSQLFKARFGQFSTLLHLWTSGGWQLYYRADRKISDDEVLELAAKTATALMIRL